ncbi:MAG: nitroreductase family protein [Coriobacteriales bacterium]|jgi:nitroreductase
MNAIFTRTSVRTYSDKPIEQDKREKILRAGMQAPSAGNQQPWEFAVIDDPNMLEKLGKATPYSAPTGRATFAVVPLMRSEGLRFANLVQQDMGACVENMLLEATELGIGSVWQAVYPEQDRIDNVNKIISTPEGLTPFCLVAFGYPEGGELPAQKSRYDESRVHVNGF